MKTFLKNRAFVLKVYPLGEADRNLLLLTEDFGKIHCLVKGIAKSKKRERVATEAMSYVEFQFYKKGDQFIVNQFSSLEIYTGIRGDLDRLGIALYLLHLVNQFVYEGYRVPKIFQLLEKSLDFLNRTEDRKEQVLLLAFFLLSLMQEEGIVEEAELRLSLEENEAELLELLLGKQIVKIRSQERYDVPKILNLIRRLEYYVGETLEIKISMKDYMLGGNLC